VGLLAGVLVGNVVEGCGAAQRFIANVCQGIGGRPAGAIGLALAGATMLGTVVADASPALIGSAEALARSGADGRLGLDIPCPLHHVNSMVAAEVGFIAGCLLS
jgi:hypothetical protein